MMDVQLCNDRGRDLKDNNNFETMDCRFKLYRPLKGGF